MRFLNGIFENYSPRYILDAGANVGFSSRLFKSIWPESFIVSVEPDYENFEALQMNLRSLQGVHPFNAGLWGRKARIGLSGNYGEWGRIFGEVTGWFQGMQAYGVNDLAKKFNVPAFEFVKIDVEGAEAKVFDPSLDLSWINSAKVISLEVHDRFAGYFGMERISPRIYSVMSGRPFTMLSDNEHVFYVSNDIMDDLLKR
jgi:FkbM family methyltransferase